MDAAAAAENAAAQPGPSEGGSVLRRRANTATADSNSANTSASTGPSGATSTTANTANQVDATATSTSSGQTQTPVAGTRAEAQAWMRERVVVPCIVVTAAAVATTTLCAVALLSGKTQTLAVAAFVATLSSALLVRFAMQLGAVAAAHPHLRRGGVHRLTGERAAYVRTSQRLAMMDRDFTAADYEMLLDLDNNSTRLRRFLEGASQDFIDRLPTYSYEPIDEQKEDRSSKDSSEPGQGGASEGPSKNATDPELGGDALRRCAICLEDFESGMRIRVLPCWHRFMADCIDPWLLEQAKCPICKASIHQ